MSNTSSNKDKSGGISSDKNKTNITSLSNELCYMIPDEVRATFDIDDCKVCEAASQNHERNISNIIKNLSERLSIIGCSETRASITKNFPNSNDNTICDKCKSKKRTHPKNDSIEERERLYEKIKDAETANEIQTMTLWFAVYTSLVLCLFIFSYRYYTLINIISGLTFAQLMRNQISILWHGLVQRYWLPRIAYSYYYSIFRRGYHVILHVITLSLVIILYIHTS